MSTARTIGAAFAAALLTLACAPADGEPVNLLLVTLDSVRPERFERPEAYFDETMPLALRHFLAESSRFATCVSSAPGTLPAAASILTGRHPRDLGLPAPDRRLPADVPTLAEVLRDAGFDTAAFVAPFSLRPRSGISRGFAHYDAPGAYRFEDYEVTERARAWLREPERLGKRWFLWVHFNAAHGPYVALETTFLPLNFFYRAARAVPWPERRVLPLSRSNSGQGGLPDYQRVGPLTAFEDYRPKYDARVREGEWFANELRHVLKFTGQYRDTVMVVVGTHGEALGEHGVEFDHGENLYPEVSRVPLFVRVPGRPGGDVPGTASHVDLVPTALAALGLPPVETRGRDLLAPGAPGESGVAAFSELYRPIGPGRWTAVTRGEDSLVRDAAGELARFRGGDGAVGVPDDLRRALEAFERIPVADAPSVDVSERDAARLHVLGYSLSRFE